MDTEDSSFSSSDGPSLSLSAKLKEEQRKRELAKAIEKISTEKWELVPNPKETTSDVWKANRFYLARDRSTKQYVDFAQCQKCGEVKRYALGGPTSVLKRHYEKCANVKKGSLNCLVSLEMKRDMKDVLIDFCVGDIRPFNVVEGENFARVIQKALDMGAEHGRINAAELLPSATTISRGLKAKADEARQQVIPKLAQAIKEGCLAATTDMWVEDCNKYHFLTLTVHFINDEWELESLILFTSEFPYESATATNISAELRTNLAKFIIFEANIHKINFVTDGGLNVVNSLEEYNRLYCVAHNLNIVSSHLFSVKLSEVDLFGYTGKVLVQNVETLVELLNSKSLNKTLTKPIPLTKDAAVGRYKSKVPMLQSLYEQYNEVSFRL